MKKHLLSFALLALALTGALQSTAQLTYGGRLGLNLANIAGDYEGDESPGMLTSFYLGAAVNYELSDKLFLAPELNFSVKGAHDKTEASITILGSTTSFKNDVKSKLSYLEIPINVGFKLGEKAFVKAGPYVGLLMAANSKGTSESTIGGITTSTDVDTDTKDFYNGVDFGINLGLGFKINDNFGAEARFSQGLSNIADSDLGNDTYTNRVISVGVFYLLGE